MINIRDHSFLNAARRAFLSLYETNNRPDDTELLKEDVSLIHIIQNKRSANWVTVLNKKFLYSDEYKNFSPYVNPNLIQKEKDYWEAEFFESDKSDWIIDYLRKFPFSKRAIILLWKNRYTDLSKTCPCTSSIFFRIKDGKLEMHSTVRANNASFLLFLDISFMLAFQSFIADQLGIRPGDYYHFVNSLHFYKTEEEFSALTYAYLKNIYNSNEKLNKK